MLDVDTIDREHLSQLCGMYAHGGLLFGTDLIRKQKKFRKWVQKHYAYEIQTFPREVQACFAPEVSDAEVVSFFAACEERRAYECQHRLDPLLPLGEAVVAAVETILEEDYWPKAIEKNGRCALLVEDGEAYRRILVLQNAEGFSQLPDGGYLLDAPKIEYMLDKYRISGELDGVSEPLSACFSGAQVEVECFNCVETMIHWNNPWEYVGMIARQLIFKAELPGNHCNELEHTLLPLLREVSYLTGVWDEEPRLPLLKQMAQRLNFSRLEKQLTKAESARKNKLRPVMRRLNIMLRQREYETIWREIFEKIRQSQMEYPRKTDVQCDFKTLQNVRGRVQCFMEQQGYTGTYPDFEKQIDFHGVRLAESYGQSYFVCREKNAVSIVHCMETFELGGPAIHFLVGTALLREGEEQCDVYSCLFDAKGRRMFRMVRDLDLVYELGEEREPDRLERLATIAIKKSQLQKLTKEEKKIPHVGFEPSNWTIFWLVFLFAGGFFGVVMTLAMMLLTVVALLLFGQFSQILSFMTTAPWLRCLAFCWVSFGASMGIVTVLGKRK